MNSTLRHSRGHSKAVHVQEEYMSDKPNRDEKQEIRGNRLRATVQPNSQCALNLTNSDACCHQLPVGYNSTACIPYIRRPIHCSDFCCHQQPLVVPHRLFVAADISVCLMSEISAATNNLGVQPNGPSPILPRIIDIIQRAISAA